MRDDDLTTYEASDVPAIFGGGGMGASDLEKHARAIRKTMAEAHTGPTRAALMLVDLLDAWEERGYRDMTPGGIDGDAWAAQVFGNALAAGNARRTVAAVAKVTALGFTRDADVLTNIDHGTLIYLAGASIPKERRRECVTAVLQAQKKRRGNLFSMTRARRLCVSLLGKTTTPRATAKTIAAALDHIALLETRLRKAGADVPPRPAMLAG